MLTVVMKVPSGRHVCVNFCSVARPAPLWAQVEVFAGFGSSRRAVARTRKRISWLAANPAYFAELFLQQDAGSQHRCP